MMRSCWLVLALAASASAQTPDPAFPFLDKAYVALRSRSYAEAVMAFEDALRAAPNRQAIYKDLAYTLLKIGETEAARDRFAEAMRLDPTDLHVALEYAFLCYETKQQAAARRVFDRIRRQGNATAEAAFQNIDRQLAEGIARWSHAVEISPGNFSAHEELARLAEQRDELAVAAEHYRTAWKLRPEQRALLLDLGRVWKQQGLEQDAQAALLAASRGAEPRAAEAAREILPSRYPYVYEFEAALRLDPGNTALRRELAYLFLEMGRKADAEEQFRQVVRIARDDMVATAQVGFLRLGQGDIAAAMPLLERVLQCDDEELVDRVREALKMPRTLRKRSETTRTQTSVEAKQLAGRSLEAGYLKDALKYLQIAHDNDPIDFETILKLGWTYNILQNDREAVEWFRLARKSPDPQISAEASQAYRNLRPAVERFSSTIWALPFYSSRWKDLFTYAQAKTETRAGHLPLRLYASLRFAGDARRTAPLGSVNELANLSENGIILGAGIATLSWKGIRGWAEAGILASYVRPLQGKRIGPDYRGGVSITRGFGHHLGPKSRGFFTETTGDGVFISRFGNDFLLYLQNKAGFTLPKAGPLEVQAYWNVNATNDLRRFYWANTLETGPGLRFRIDGMPRSLAFTVNALHGRYLKNEESPLGRGYSDLRAGFWYAFSR